MPEHKYCSSDGNRLAVRRLCAVRDGSPHGLTCCTRRSQRSAAWRCEPDQPGSIGLLQRARRGELHIRPQVLKELGYHYIESSDALGALPHLQSEQPIDLLVTDVGLPNMNGRQLAEIARELRPDLRILFMTGYAEKSVARNRFLAPECS